MIIKAKNLSRTYPTKIPTLALRGVDFSIKQGEFVAIMGRSGCGKSTLLHQLGLIDDPTTGELFIDGTDVLKLSESEINII